ncbi:single-stranded DNA-binding protein [Microbacterium sp. PM5]|uniref:single-stranded DNA-binding protein n=1 Tax=Microbacterium sp. PM5 TaxID=2014534 RepID=UPI000DD164D2|nr:single-stranded DNA-binding protein [Microbacterium sp. PM5]AXA95431.1 single-stranded DNA-binding protein [Microbacterium sp. PM5]
MSIKTIVGRLGNAPEVRATQSGKTVVSFSVAETKRKFDRNTNEWADDFTIWHDIESWQNTDAIAALTKGDQVIVVGEERDASYEHRETGKTVRRIVVRAQSVGVVVRDGKPQGGQQSAGAWAPATQQTDAWAAQDGEQF